MDAYKSLILKHYEKYPKMQIQDFVKLFYENSFGPLHMSFGKDLEGVKIHLQHEIDLLKPNMIHTPIEDIGNDYVRVSLFMVKDGALTVDELAGKFYQSMESSPTMEDKDIERFLKQLEVLRDLILENKIDLPLKQTDVFLEGYLYEGIRPLHHSDVYKSLYHPHYRVVHKQLLEDVTSM